MTEATIPVDLRPALAAGVEELGLKLASEQVDQLLAYLGLVHKWNKVYNLTALREPAQMLTHHLLDSLSVVPPLLRQTEARPIRLLDAGSGGGLPGVVIAITCPQVSVTCVDTVAKKAAFVQQVAATLALRNLKGLHARVESIVAGEGGEPGFDVVCSRAFASLGDFTQWSEAALKPDGVWMAMKGKHPEEELAVLGGDVDVFHVEQLAVPGLDAERCVLWMRPAIGSH